MIYITGDTHRNFEHIKKFCKKHKTKRKEDIMIILGDSGINYYMDARDKEKKKQLTDIPITFFCIHGNHEQRPQEIAAYEEITWNKGAVYVEKQYPNILFAKDGEVFCFNDKKYLVVGGAYSVDKQYRQLRGYNWWDNEQPDELVRSATEAACEIFDWKFHGILTHTCPCRYEPIEVFLPGIDQRKVDKSTELWLDDLEERLTYNIWYAGHYHTEKMVDKMRFLYNSIEELK